MTAAAAVTAAWGDEDEEEEEEKDGGGEEEGDADAPNPCLMARMSSASVEGDMHGEEEGSQLFSLLPFIIIIIMEL